MMTCPANMVTTEGTMNLGNHDQWMDAETIVCCQTALMPRLIKVYDFIDENIDDAAR